MTEFLFKELTHKIIGIYFDVYNVLSRGYPEFVYESAMQRDLQRQGVRCKRQEDCQVLYQEKLVGIQKLDLLVAEEVVVEIKALPNLTPLHKAQTFSYLKAFDKRVALLLNFSNARPEFERLFFQPRSSQTTTKPVEQAPADLLPADLISPELVYEIIGGLYTVHATLGPGFIHRIYANACYHELQQRGLPVRAQKEMRISYKGEPVASIKLAHLRVSDIALVFPVATTDVNNISFNNLKDWLRTEQVPLAIIANFYEVSLKPVILKV